MRIFLIFICLTTLTLTLSGCNLLEKNEPKAVATSTTQGSGGIKTEQPCTEVPPMDEAAMQVWKTGILPGARPGSIGSGNIVTVNYTLRLCREDGKIFDTSREQDAKSAGIYNSGRTYEPFQTIIGTHQTVRGFEYGLIGMQKGERKTIAVSATDGYGIQEKNPTRTEKVPKYVIAPEYPLTLDKNLFADVVKEKIEREKLGELGKSIKVGQTLTGGENAHIFAKVVKVNEKEVEVEVDNSKNPFHGKKLAVGVSSEVQSGTTFTIKSVAGTGITFDVKNLNSPFYGKYTTGSVADTPFGKITLRSIDADTVTLDIPTEKDEKKTTLYFDVEIVDIK